MFRLADLGSAVAGKTARFDQFNSIDEFATPVTLVALRIVVVTKWAFTSDKSISQESVAF